MGSTCSGFTSCELTLVLLTLLIKLVFSISAIDESVKCLDPDEQFEHEERLDEVEYRDRSECLDWSECLDRSENLDCSECLDDLFVPVESLERVKCLDPSEKAESLDNVDCRDSTECLDPVDSVDIVDNLRVRESCTGEGGDQSLPGPAGAPGAVGVGPREDTGVRVGRAVWVNSLAGRGGDTGIRIGDTAWEKRVTQSLQSESGSSLTSETSKWKSWMADKPVDSKISDNKKCKLKEKFDKITSQFHDKHDKHMIKYNINLLYFHGICYVNK